MFNGWEAIVFQRVFFFIVFIRLLAIEAYAAGPNLAPQTSTCGCASKPARISLRHIEANGLGYNQGYSTLEIFFSPNDPVCGRWIPFLDVRGHVFNNARIATNAGVGLRYLSFSNSDWRARVWGINTYYDYRNTSHSSYHQAALGLESLGQTLDFRLNGYLPFGHKKSSYYDLQFDHFANHYMFQSRKREFVMKGANAEVGAHIKPFKYLPLYLAAGPYYLTNGKSIWGGEARIAIDCCDYIRLEGSSSYDHLFKWIGQGQISLSFAFGGKREVKPTGNHSCATTLALSDRAVQRVDRNEIIPVNHKRFQSRAIDPATGLPFFFWFVDSRSSSLGNFESPFPDLVSAGILNSNPGDFIYVFQVGGSLYDATNFTMQDYQHLWGSGIAQQLQTNWGSVTVPAFTTGLPMITSAALNTQPIIALSAHGCEVSGIHVMNTNSNLIGIGLQSSIRSANIHNNLIDMGTVDSSGAYTGLAGIYAFSFSILTDTSLYNFNQNTINLTLSGAADFAYGIYVQPSADVGNSQYNFIQNTINLTMSGSDTGEGGTGIFIVNSATTNNAQYNINQNIITINGSNSSYGCGIEVFSRYISTDNSKYNFNQNTIDLNLEDSNGSGIVARSAGANNESSTNNSQYTFNQNMITMTQYGSGSSNVGIFARFEGGNLNAQYNNAQYTFDQNTIAMNVSNSPTYGIYVDSIEGSSENITTNSRLFFNQNNLVFSGTTILDGIYISASSFSSGMIYLSLINNYSFPYQILLDRNGGLFSFDLINNFGNNPLPTIE